MTRFSIINTPFDVLQNDDRVINHEADREKQSQKRDHVN